VLEGDLRNFVNNDQGDWYQILLLAEYAYNNSKTSAHKLTPFSPTTGSIHKPNREGERDSKPRSHNVYALDENSAGKREDNLEQTREAMKKYYDRKATP